MRPISRVFLLPLLFICLNSYGQIDKYGYKRELKGVSEQWHRIVLPDDLFGKVNGDFSDIRIYGITSSGDTIEAPYIIKQAAEKVLSKDVSFKIINRSYNENGYFFTFEVPTKQDINRINLDFGQSNFDWRLKLEGSNNQQEWFTIVENYRVLSIKNAETDYRFTAITFPNSKYRFFRVFVVSDEQPVLNDASIKLYEVTDGKLKDYGVKAINVENVKQSKQTVIDIELNTLLPVCYLKVNVKETYDFYRPISIRYLTDSVKTEQGWRYNYFTLTTGTLSSLEDNIFRFTSAVASKFKVVINNYDNNPLTVEGCDLKGYEYDLVARFTSPASYYLVYGNQFAAEPRYDIGEFAERIPSDLRVLQLGDEIKIGKVEKNKRAPLFKDKMWLWGIMALIILILGWFSVRMIKKK
ncbi:MAG: DUF3999 family protein [Bacteroidales bacterium]